MKPYFKIILTVSALSCVALPSYAALNNDTTTSTTSLGYLQKASKIVGLVVKDQQNQRLGKVHDLAVQLGTGRILAVIVSTGGFLDVHEKLVALPPSKFTVDSADKTLRLDVDQAQLRDAPTFEMSRWNENAQESAFADLNQRYGVTADTTQYPTGEGRTAVDRASKVIGMRVHNDQNENLGKVENLIVDLPAGRIVEVILSTGGFLGMGDTLSEVPAQSFRNAPEHDRLVLNTTREALANAPHFKSNDWPNPNDSAHFGSVYAAYNTTPYFNTNQVDNSAQNSRDRSNNSLNAESQTNNKGDVDITARIRRELTSTEGLSVDAKNVKIITVDGHVTLRGPVNNDDEKHQIAAIAARVVPSDNIDNQLQSKTNPTPVNSNQ
jgi:sporulation protein YlmC with PRC-barrel domain